MKADVIPYKSRFLGAIKRHEEGTFRIDELRNFIMFWDNGRMYMCGYQNGEFVRREVLYVHIQKRRFDLDEFDSLADRFVIYPNKIVSLQEDADADKELKKYWRTAYFKGFIKTEEIRRTLYLLNHWFKKYILRK